MAKSSTRNRSELLVRGKAVLMTCQNNTAVKRFNAITATLVRDTSSPLIVSLSVENLQTALRMLCMNSGWQLLLVAESAMDAPSELLDNGSIQPLILGSLFTTLAANAIQRGLSLTGCSPISDSADSPKTSTMAPSLSTPLEQQEINRKAKANERYGKV